MRPRIVIVGAGFAGLAACIALERSGVMADITLIGRDESFEYTPALHLCTTRPERLRRIMMPLVSYPCFVQDEIVRVEKGRAVGAKGSYPFDHCIVATGSGTSFYGNDSFREHAVEFKRVKDIAAIRERLPTAGRIVVIGGGYTGVEAASVLAAESGKEVHLVHPGELVLDSLSRSAARYATRWLRKRGVMLHLGQRVERCDEGRVVLSSGTRIESGLVILSAGIAPNDALLGKDPTLRADLSLASDVRIFVAGDAGRSGRLPTAHNAIIEGYLAADTIVARIRGIPAPAPKHRDWRFLAVALGRHSGFFTWRERIIPHPFVGLSKLLIERIVMWGFRNRVRLPF
ncbi:FAD-dependent oxidoreductase [Candidatus Woesearchaeota archaeon]|nr:FAD-dependent oxidoreductase [Candidatus Woesearchaeota archaeon]